jgi:hypothetical protein
MDMDGTDDLTLQGTATLTSLKAQNTQLEAEANFTLGGIIGSDLDITGSGSVTVMGGGEQPSIFLISPGAFTITHTDGSEVQIAEMGLEVDITFPANPYLYGYICFRARGGGSELEAELIFAPNGMGGWLMRVQGADWDFVVP